MAASPEAPYGISCYPMGAQKRSSASSKRFYNNLSCSVIHKKLTDLFSVRSEVRQSCVLSPMLFVVAIDWIMGKTIGNKDGTSGGP